jgi:hypothetical protein
MFEIELLNPSPSSRRTKDGPVRRISFEVSKEVYEAFMDAAESNLRLIGRLAVAHDNDDEPAADAVNGKPKREKKAKGPHGQLWRELYLSGFSNAPGIREAVEDARETPEQSAWAALHAVFGGVESLALVSPEQIYQRFPPDEYPAVKTMVEQALRKAAV